MLTIKKAGTEAIPVIREMAHAIWPVAYADILAPQQIEYMLDKMYNAATLQQQMQEGQQFVLAYDADVPVAFAAYAPLGDNALTFKLHKIYILPNQQGRGTGRALINFITDAIAPATALRLNVNRHNKARFFYEKAGFKIIAEEILDIGNGYCMDDYVMELLVKHG
ncbi:MAG TPA: GNAT family N-acetyltransferase [Ferruginibacter sp.]|nr:GNAT family N-acetyltransferase [Ferruginibacter sp.]HMP21588.1 GNAT family N-acetyltransferase [Ferruginibacter sp.]